MDFHKIVIATNLEEEEREILLQLREIKFPDEAQVHMIHAFELHTMNFDFLPALRLSKEDFATIERWGEDKLQNLAEELGLFPNPNLVMKCFVSSNPKQDFLSYADRHGADLIIAGSKVREGFEALFETSFTKFLHSYSRTNLLLLRPTRRP